MPLKRLIHVSLALVATFGVQVAQGAPARATGMVRATWCCATACHHTRSKPATGECCRTASDSGDAATLSTPPTLRPPVAAVATAISPLVLAEGPMPVDRAMAGAPRARGAPIFLLTRTLRL